MGTFASELGPCVDAAPGKPRIYVDANVPAGVVRFMRDRLSWDVMYVMEHEDQRRASDTRHYRLARELHRTLITIDRDFLDERRFPRSESGGVIVVQAPDETNLVKVLSRVNGVYFGSGEATAGRPLVGQKIEVHPDWRLSVSRPARRSRRNKSYSS